jgi:hypothetical protein
MMILILLTLWIPLIIWFLGDVTILQKNWNLFSVNVAMAGTGLYQLSRKIRSVKKKQVCSRLLLNTHKCKIVMVHVDCLCRQDYFSDEKDATPALEG